MSQMMENLQLLPWPKSRPPLARVVYFLMASGEVVYVGLTQALKKRVQRHRAKMWKFNEVWFLKPWLRTKEYRPEEVEANLIQLYAPKYNIQHVGKGTVQREASHVRPTRANASHIALAATLRELRAICQVQKVETREVEL